MNPSLIRSALDVGGLEPTAKLILVALAAECAATERSCSIYRSQLCQVVGRDRRTIQRCVRTLVLRGLLRVDVNLGGDAVESNDRRPNLYTLEPVR